MTTEGLLMDYVHGLKDLNGNRFHFFQLHSVQFSHSSCVQLFGNLWIAACQASLSITNSRSSLNVISRMVISSVLFLLRERIKMRDIEEFR